MDKLLITSLYNIGDTTYLAQKVLEYSLSLTSTDVNLKKLHDELQDLYSQILEVLEQSGKSSLTIMLKSEDKLRDQGFICLRDQLCGASLSLVSERAAKAKTLFSILERLGTSLYLRGYKAETNHLESLFQSFDDDEMQTLLTDLGFSVDYQALKTAQSSFLNVQQERYDEQTTNSNTKGPAGTLANQMLPVIEDIVAYVQLFGKLDAANYKASYDLIITVVSEVNEDARTRQTIKDKRK